jgi:hypothetical protein
MALKLHPEAELEYAEAIRWYEQDYEGRGARFFEAVETAFDRIEADGAHTFPRWRRTDFRYLVTHRFPYRLIFREEPGGIVVYAVAHNKKRPGYWKKRAT